jgi:hypothetical protein
MHIKRSVFIKACTGVTGVTGFALRSQVLAIYGFGQDTGTSSFAYAPGSAEQKSLSQMLLAYGVFQGSGNMRLPHHRVEGTGAVFTCRDYKIIHMASYSFCPDAGTAPS